MIIGYTWRLSKYILAYHLFQTAASTARSHITNANEHVTPISPFSHIHDNLLKTSDLHYMQHIFRPHAPSWSEHDYDAYISNSSRKCGYFSYLFKLEDLLRQEQNEKTSNKTTSNSNSKKVESQIEKIVRHIYTVVCQYYPEVQQKAKYAEW